LRPVVISALNAPLQYHPGNAKKPAGPARA
jgi:hypothetical protein